MVCITDFGEFSRDAPMGRNGGRGLARMYDSQNVDLKSPHLTTKLQSYISYRAARRAVKLISPRRSP